MLARLTLGVFLLTSIATASLNSTCFFPDGSEAQYSNTPYVPCKETSADGVTYCCGQNDMCTVSGYCIGDAGVFYRGGCTDQTWTSGLCPELCAQVNMGGFANFYPCTPGEFSHDNWTCDSCDNPTFNFSPGRLFVPQLQAVVATATNTVTVTASPTGSVIVSSSATGAASALPNASSCPSHEITVSGMIVGLSVGVGLSAIVALVGFLVERKKRRAAARIGPTTQSAGCDQRDLKPYFGSVMAGKTEADSQMVHEIDSTHKSH